MGRRRAGRRQPWVQRKSVARSARQAVDRSPARDDPVPAPGFWSHGYPSHDRRSAGLHEALGDHRDGDVDPRHGPDGIHLSRERKGHDEEVILRARWLLWGVVVAATVGFGVAAAQGVSKTYKDSRGKAVVFPLGDASFADEV